MAVNLFLLRGTTSEMLLFLQLMFFLMNPPDRFPTFIIGKMWILKTWDFQIFTPLTWAVWIVLTGLVLFIALGGSQKSGIDTYFGFFVMYLFVMLLFLNQNSLDRSANQYISNLTSHNNLLSKRAHCWRGGKWFNLTRVILIHFIFNQSTNLPGVDSFATYQYSFFKNSHWNHVGWEEKNAFLCNFSS